MSELQIFKTERRIKNLEMLKRAEEKKIAYFKNSSYIKKLEKEIEALKQKIQ